MSIVCKAETQETSGNATVENRVMFLASNSNAAGQAEPSKIVPDVTREANFARDAASDKILCLMAEIGVEALQKAGSPGCAWLDLVPKGAE